MSQGSAWHQLTPEQFCLSAVPTLPDPSSLLAAQVLLLPSPSLIAGRHPKLAPLPCHHWAGWLRCPSGQWARTSLVTLHGPSQIQNEHQEHPAHHCGSDGAWCCLCCQSWTMGREKHGKRFCSESCTKQHNLFL